MTMHGRAALLAVVAVSLPALAAAELDAVDHLRIYDLSDSWAVKYIAFEFFDLMQKHYGSTVHWNTSEMV